MCMLDNIGHLFLNVAFVLYLILYIPQLIHNARNQTFAHMSFLMHAMMLQAYSCDLLYALTRHMPWQYLTVSCMGLICLCIQHAQWVSYCRRHHQPRWSSYLILGGLIVIWPLLIPASPKVFAWVSRAMFLFHFLPQIFKYHRHPNERDAIDMRYLLLSMGLSACDVGAAWCLSWDLPNLWGTFLSLLFKVYLFGQITLSGHADRTIRTEVILRR
jgi:uncharacterized protein with PQ loop repeat